MTGYIDSNNPMSKITIASMEDLGYDVAYEYADEYTVDDMDATVSGCVCSSDRLRKRKLENYNRRRQQQVSQASYDEAWVYGLEILKNQEALSSSLDPDQTGGDTTIDDITMSAVSVWYEDDESGH